MGQRFQADTAACNSQDQELLLLPHRTQVLQGGVELENLGTLIAAFGKPAQSHDGSTRLCHTRLFSLPCCRGTTWL